MRKNKKLLLASVAAMGALALGVGATSTFAWYTVNATANITNTFASNVSTQASVLNAGTVYLKVVSSVTTATIDYTDANGQCWVLSNGKYAKANASAVGSTQGTLGTSTFDLKAYSDAQLNNELTSTAKTTALASLGGVTYDIKAAGTGRVRVTNSATDGDVYSANMATTAFKIGEVVIAADGSYSVNITRDVRFSVSGGDEQPVEGSAPTGGKNADTHDGGTVVISLAEHAG